jgi:ribosome-binding protein aMBF1 (putative translation factor)
MTDRVASEALVSILCRTGTKPSRPGASEDVMTEDKNLEAARWLGQQVRDRREALRLTRQSLADECGIDVATLDAIESGALTNVRAVVNGHRVEEALGWATGMFERALTDGIVPQLSMF